MPTTTQLASLVVSAFDTFLIVDNSFVSQLSCSMSTGNHSVTVRGSTITSSIWVPPHPPGTHLHVAAAREISHQWCVSLTPNNSKTIGSMTCHCFLRPVRRDFRAAPTLLTLLETSRSLSSPKQKRS